MDESTAAAPVANERLCASALAAGGHNPGNAATLGNSARCSSIRLLCIPAIRSKRSSGVSPLLGNVLKGVAP